MKSLGVCISLRRKAIWYTCWNMFNDTMILEMFKELMIQYNTIQPWHDAIRYDAMCDSVKFDSIDAIFVGCY